MTASSVSSMPSSASALVGGEPGLAGHVGLHTGRRADGVAHRLHVADDRLGRVVGGPDGRELGRLVLRGGLDRARRLVGDLRQLPAGQRLAGDHAHLVGHLLADRDTVLGDLLEVGLAERLALRVEDQRGRLAAAGERPLDRVVDLDRLGLVVLEGVALVRGERLQLRLERERHGSQRSARPR